MPKFLPTVALIALMPLAAAADEVWTTPLGDIVYEQDMQGFAILSIPRQGRVATLYFPGLGGNFSNRSTHEGYWISDGPNDCGAMLYGVRGQGSRDWGRVVVAFDGPAFPTDLTLWFGSCFGQPSQPVRGLSTAK